jgi:hypothetical protein
MKRKTVRLTESELTRLIKTIVEDTKEKMDMDFEMPDRGGFDVMSAVRKASKMFEREFAEELSDREMMKLERLADKIDVERVMSKLERSQGEDLDDREEKASDKIEDIIKQVSESYLTEGKFDRIKSILARAGIFGGLGLMTVSGLAFVSQIPGHVDFEYLDRVYEMVQSLGCSRYCGPYAFYIAVLGVIMFFAGRAERDLSRDEKIRTKRSMDDLEEGYY